MRDLREYYRPATAGEAVEIKRAHGQRAVYLGGASDLLVHRPAGVEVAIDIRHADISGVGQDEDWIVIGGGARLRDVEGALGSVCRGMLREAVRDTAPWLIRNAATLAGNIANASPAADSVPALLALDARLVLLDGDSEAVSIEDILIGPHRNALGDRLIREIRIPASAGRRAGAFVKLARSKSDIALVNLAVSLDVDADVMRSVRVALGAVAPTGVRAPSAESVLEGQPPTHDVLARAADALQDDIHPISDIRASESYRRRTSGVLLRRAITTALDRARNGAPV